MRTSRAVFLILVCLLSAGLIAACGDDDDGGGGDSAEEFIAQADEICTDDSEEAVANPLPTPTTAEEAVSVLEVSLQRREDVLADLEALGDPPSEIADEWGAYLETVEQRIRVTQENLKFARKGTSATDPRVVRSVERGSELDQEGNEILEGIGSTACAEVIAPDDRKEIVEFVTFWETKPFPGECERYTTEDGIEVAFGSVAECEKTQRGLTGTPEDLTKSLKVTEVEGIAEVRATVDATLVGGSNDGAKIRYTVVFEDGHYKMDAVTLQPGET